MSRIHSHPCGYCPAALDGDNDPELVDMKSAGTALQAQFAFVCSWRPDKVCKGYCDYYGLTEADIEGAMDGRQGQDREEPGEAGRGCPSLRGGDAGQAA